MKSRLWPVLLVVMQFGLIFISILLSDGVSEWWQLFLFLGGVALGVWAILTMKLKVSVLPTVHTDQKLYISGPYRFIRHPMYTAVLFVCGAMLFNSIEFIDVMIWVTLLGVLIVKLRYEEGELMRKFPEYANYMRRTKRLLPLIY